MDRITSIHIENVRSIEKLDLDLAKPLTVLIGENGSGKSTILECLELLRKAAEPGFIQRFYELHRGLPGLLRKGAPSLTLGLTIEDDEGKLPRLDYRVSLAVARPAAMVLLEYLAADDGGPRQAEVFFRTAAQPPSGRLSKELGGLMPEQLAISSFGAHVPHPAIERVLAVLRGIEVHLPFDTRASWAARSYRLPESIRGSATHFPAERLNLLGFNLANAWSELRNQPSGRWEHTLALLRLGLGDRVDTVVTPPDMGGGNIYLAVRFTDLAEPVLASDLSDGQLSWLAFVAMARLNAGRSLLAVDEPELHLHPALLGRVVALLAELDGGAPALLSTHSDRVLEMIDDPVAALRVCSLDGSRSTVARLDAAELPKWLERFGDLGHLRESGYLPLVLIAAGPALLAPRVVAP